MSKLFKILFLALAFPLIGLAQNDGANCENYLSKAEENYQIGDFNAALDVLKQYKSCNKGTEDWKYNKLLAKIYLGKDEQGKAKEQVVKYVKKKKENVISENDPQLLQDFTKYVDDSIKRYISDSIRNSIVHLDTIFSASKTPEILSQTPATILIIKDDEIFEKGYTDIIDVLSNVPGFDISKVYGATYSNVFQRGFRQENTERTLFMVNGIEENDIWSNIAYISRQYPVNNIKRIEVVYGPSSTIYGPRAFVGAVNIITKTYDDIKNGLEFSMLDSTLNCKTIGTFTGSQYNTKSADLTVALKHKRFSFTITGKYYESDEHDMSEEEFHNFDPDDYEKYSSRISSLTLEDNPYTIENEIHELETQLGTSIELHEGYRYTDNTNTIVELTEVGIEQAKKKDREGYLQKINGAPIGFSNATRDWYIGGNLKVGNLDMGYRTWKRKEGFQYYQDLFAAGSDNGSNWAPVNSTFYTKYDQKLGNWNFSNLTTFKIHGIDKESIFVSYRNYAIGVGDISYVYSDEDDPGHGWLNVHYYYEGQQFRNDAKLTYSKDRVKFLSGLEFRNSQVQGSYLTFNYFATDELISKDSIAKEIARAGNLVGGNQYNITDLSIYSQLNYRVIDKHLFATLGGRIDNNQDRKAGDGFGTVFSPKAALIGTSPYFVTKLIYSQGLQSPAQWTKYTNASGRNPNPLLKPEKVQNVDLTFMNPNELAPFQWTANGYYSLIKDAISLGVDPSDDLYKHLNNGNYRVLGVQLQLKYRASEKLSLDFNSTFNNAKQTDTDKLIGDIAKFRSNGSATYRLKFNSHKLAINLLGNYVGARPVGENTTVIENPGIDNSGYIPQYFSLSSSVSYWHEDYSNLRVQISGNNLFNSTFYHPGQRSANATETITGHVPWVVQPGRRIFVRLIIGL